MRPDFFRVAEVFLIPHHVHITITRDTNGFRMLVVDDISYHFEIRELVLHNYKRYVLVNENRTYTFGASQQSGVANIYNARPTSLMTKRTFREDQIFFARRWKRQNSSRTTARTLSSTTRCDKRTSICSKTCVSDKFSSIERIFRIFSV